ncbi:alpha/beta fold hydrolase [Dankookia sp. P2]|uniref:alpha/beta fold hydrolase n=1 Tax=Dankookia sp. P2 TaxID=3423955 RepID=UPI003D6675A0
MLGFKAIGHGPTKIVLIHDWLGDHTTYAPAEPYIDQSRFTVILPDLRGYGLSRHLDGFSLDQAVGDLVALVDALGIERFAVAGHSMSGMIALKLALELSSRVTHVILSAPVSADGLTLDEGGRAFFEAVARDQGACRDIVAAVTGGRYDAAWLDYKARRSRETSTEAARLGYFSNMLLGPGFADALPRLAMPVLVLTGAHDTDGFKEADLRGKLDGVLPSVQFETILEAGHYPMQEAPVRFASLLQAFVA